MRTKNILVTGGFGILGRSLKSASGKHHRPSNRINTFQYPASGNPKPIEVFGAICKLPQGKPLCRQRQAQDSATNFQFRGIPIIIVTEY